MILAIKHWDIGFDSKIGRDVLWVLTHHHHHQHQHHHHHRCHHYHHPNQGRPSNLWSLLLFRDLVLAGEFGRELLQTNDELRAALERHRQESARRIEVVMMVMVVMLFMVIYWHKVMSSKNKIKRRDLNRKGIHCGANWKTSRTLGRWQYQDGKLNNVNIWIRKSVEF